MDKAELVLDCRNRHGEGILWNPADGRVWWTDIDGLALWWLDPASGKADSIAMPDRLCCFAPRRKGGFILALADRFVFFDPATGDMDAIAPFEPDNSETRLNDGRTDRQGRFVAGGMNEITLRADSSLQRVDADGMVTTIVKDVAISNSTCFSPDGRTMYFTDTPTDIIRAYDYDTASGTPSNPRPLFDMTDEPGHPDGSCVDEEGCLWNAVWQGSRVVRITPDGAIDRIVHLPASRVTCCAFGGADLGTLYITTSQQGAAAEELSREPHAGSLFAFRPGVRGLADVPFAG